MGIREYSKKEQRNLAKNLSHLLKESSLTMRETARRLGYHQGNFSEWMNGKRFPDDDALCDIADFYGVSVPGILGDRLPRQKVRIELPSGLIVSAGTDLLSVEGVDVSSGLDDVKIERYNANTAIVRVALKGKIL